MARIPDEIIQQIRDRVDLVDLVGRFVTLKKAGRNYKGLCPFHGEKTPSFNVNPDRQGFYCFGCQEGGNAITLPDEDREPELPRGGARAGGASAASRSPRRIRASAALAERLYEANEIAQAAYRAALAAPGNPALAYLDEARHRRRQRSSASGSASRPTAGTPSRSACASAASRRSSASAPASSPRAAPAGTTTGCAGASPSRSATRAAAILGFGGRALARRSGAQVPEHAREPDLPQARGLLRLPDGARSDPPRRARGGRRGLLRSDRAAPRRRRGGARHLRHRAQRRARARSAAAHEARWCCSSTATRPGSARCSARSRCCCPRACACARRCCRPARIPTASCAAQGAEALRGLVDRAAPALDRVIERAARARLRHARGRRPTPSPRWRRCWR